MTPFDPIALLAILVTFYADVSPAALQRAHDERPEYFAGGTIIGTHGDALRLPDGFIWDLIFDVDGPAPRWQAIVPSGDPTGAGGDAFFPLTPGPLRPVVSKGFIRAGDMGSLVGVVADALFDVDASDALLGGTVDTLRDQAEAGNLDDAFEGAIGPPLDALSGDVDSLHQADPGDVLAVTADQVAHIDAAESDYDTPIPDDIDTGAPSYSPPAEPTSTDDTTGRDKVIPPRPPQLPQPPTPPVDPTDTGGGGSGGGHGGDDNNDVPQG